MNKEKQYDQAMNEGGEGFNPHREYVQIEEDLDDKAYRLRNRLNGMSFSDFFYPKVKAEYDAVMAKIAAGEK